MEESEERCVSVLLFFWVINVFHLLVLSSISSFLFFK